MKGSVGMYYEEELLFYAVIKTKNIYIVVLTSKTKNLLCVH